MSLRLFVPTGEKAPDPCEHGGFRRLNADDLDVLPSEMIEAVAREIHPGKWWDEPHLWKASIALYRNEAKTVLRAGLSAGGENQK